MMNGLILVLSRPTYIARARSGRRTMKSPQSTLTFDESCKVRVNGTHAYPKCRQYGCRYYAASGDDYVLPELTQESKRRVRHVLLTIRPFHVEI